MRYEQLKELIPLYVNKTISEKNKKILLEALKNHPELKLEMEEFENINSTYSIEDIQNPPPKLYDDIVKNIHMEKAETNSDSISSEAIIKKLQSFLKLPAFTWSLVAIQFIAILFLFTLNYGGNKFMTTSANLKNYKCSHKMDVVFKENTTIRQVNIILNSIKGNIIYGPSPDDMYVVCIKHIQNHINVIKKLLSSGCVKLVEKEQ